MHKSEKIEIFKNIFSSWVSLGINVIVGILLSPFIVHRLGDTAFGIWVLIFLVTGYYGLFDLGIRSSVVRYVSKYTATDDREDLTKVINTSLFSFTCIGIFTLLITVAVAFSMNSLFHIPADYQSTARWLLLLVGASVALGFPLGIFAGVLEGIQKFYILYGTNVVSTLLRALLIVIYLRRGYGLITLALITVLLPLLTAIVRGVIAMRMLQTPLALRYVDRRTFREMANYGGVTFMIILAGRLKFKTDEIVIGTFLSAAAITYFNFGARIVDYAVEVVTNLSSIFVPMASQSEARGDLTRLRKMFIAGNRSCAFIILPISAVLIILGKSVIEVWVGRKYVAASYPVLVILTLATTLMLMQSTSGRMLFGMGKHRTWAIVSLVEGVANLVLSIILVRTYGIVGDALGTAIPLTCSFLFFMPAHLCRLLGIRMRSFLMQAFGLPVLLCIPTVAVLLVMRHWLMPHTFLQLGLELSVAGAVYGGLLLWAYMTNRVLHVDLSPVQTTSRAGLRVVSPAVETQQDV